jgi:thymidylate kinase
VIVEFLGLPGAGKTSVSVLAAELLAGRGFAVRSDTLNRFDGVGAWQRLAAVAGNPGLSMLLAGAVPGSGWRARLAAGNRLVRRDRLRRRVPDGTLIDSGVLFAACGTSRRMGIEVAAIAARVTWPDAIVHLRLDADVALARVRARAQPNVLLDVDDDEARRSLADYERLISDVVAAVTVPTIEVRADEGDLQHVAARVADELLGFMRSAGTG